MQCLENKVRLYWPQEIFEFLEKMSYSRIANMQPILMFSSVHLKAFNLKVRRALAWKKQPSE